MISLDYLILEVTRRCNELCKICMRGEPESIDMSRDIVDLLLLDQNIIHINCLSFSGGEPILNEDLICYIIELIIKYDIDVDSLYMVSNGKSLNEMICESLNDYIRHRELKHKICEVKIDFSVDKYHENNSYIIKKYQENYPQFSYDLKELDEHYTYKTGRSLTGKEFKYRILPLLVNIINDQIHIRNYLYITAKGNYETLGDGSFKDMDRINMGSVFDKTLLDILDEYGDVVIGDKHDFKKLTNRIQKRNIIV